MATEKELLEKGWQKENDTTWGRPDSNQKLDVIKTDTGELIHKNQGENDVYKK